MGTRRIMHKGGEVTTPDQPPIFTASAADKPSLKSPTGGRTRTQHRLRLFHTISWLPVVCKDLSAFPTG